MTHEGAIKVLSGAYPGCRDADPALLDAICSAVANAEKETRESCAKIAETYGVIGWLEYKDEWTVTVVHDAQRIVARAIREG